MRFTPYPKATRDEATPQRMRAAERNVAAQREKFALFPEFMEDRDAVERVARILDARVEDWRERRKRHAQDWRSARRRLAALRDGTRRGVLRYWQAGGLPGSPEYLATITTQAEQGVCFWHKLADLRRLWLIGQGRLPSPWRNKG